MDYCRHCAPANCATDLWRGLDEDRYCRAVLARARARAPAPLQHVAEAYVLAATTGNGPPPPVGS